MLQRLEIEVLDIKVRYGIYVAIREEDIEDWIDLTFQIVELTQKTKES
jgi:hypothetical protein